MKRLRGILMLVLLSTTAVGCVGTQASSPDIAQLKKRAAAGNADAQTTRGVAYDNGQGVPEDYIQAYKWYNLAAASGSAGAKNAKDSLAKVMTTQQIAEAQKLSMAFKPTTP